MISRPENTVPAAGEAEIRGAETGRSANQDRNAILEATGQSAAAVDDVFSAEFSRPLIPRGGGKLHDSVVRTIGGWILGGKYQPGGVLPSESDIATKLGISRTATREAIKVVSAKGLIESRPRVGAVVRPRDEWSMLDAALLSWHPDIRKDQELIAALIEARRIIEPAAAELAAMRCSAADLAAIEAAYLDMERAIPVDLEACCEADLAFHRGVISASHNIVLKNLIGTIQAALRASFLNSTRDILMSQQQMTLSVHRVVLERIRVRDAVGARNAMLELLHQAANDILDPKSGT